MEIRNRKERKYPPLQSQRNYRDKADQDAKAWRTSRDEIQKQFTKSPTKPKPIRTLKAG